MEKTIKNQQFINLGRKDKAYVFYSKWPLLKLDILDKKGIWVSIQNRLKFLTDNGELNPISNNHIEKFFQVRPEIDFEIEYFNYMMTHTNLFKYKNQIYCYSYGLIDRKKNRKINARYYFNVGEVLGMNLPI
jgi:hypothetical protein